MVETMTGGCQCGRVRYRVEVDDQDAYLRHCRMCQRATGGVSIAFKSVGVGRVAWEHEPDWNRSSPIGCQPFCSACGTSLGFAFVDGADTMDLTVGSFDDPSRMRPAHHDAAESMHAAWIDTRDLPRTRREENASVAQRWRDAVGHLPA